MLAKLLHHLKQINQSPCRWNETNSVAYNFDLLPLVTNTSPSGAIIVVRGI